MYKMVSEFGNEIKIVSSAIERNALISQGWHEEVKTDIPKAVAEKPKEVKTSGKSNRSKKNIR